MHVTGLQVEGFRSLGRRSWQFAPGKNVFVAPNGTGKSNLIEALSLLSTGDSWRADATDEFIAWEAAFGRIEAKVQQAHESVRLEQIFTHGSLQGHRTTKRQYKRNGVGRRRQDVIGDFLTVLFTPEDMDVFHTGPAHRRKLLDRLLDQISPQYRRARRQYEQALRRRNKLIMALREGEVDRYAFFAWDRLLIEHGGVMHDERARFLHWLGAQAGIREAYQVTYDHSTVTEARLHHYAQAEVGAGHTLVGPHKDDVQLAVKRGGEWRDLAVYGSRGEQRLALLWWKMGELQYLEERHHERPVLLLDDVFSELDPENQQYLRDATMHTQSIITTAEPLADAEPLLQ